jgi:hypothetical protein
MDKIHPCIFTRGIHYSGGALMDVIQITCTNNDRTKQAEVLERTDKYMKVQVPGTQLFIEMFRDDVNIPYTGRTAGLEFEWQPKN